MRVSVRPVLIALGLAFTAYMAARGLWWTSPVLMPSLVVGALVLYLVTTWLCLADRPQGVSGGGPTKLPLWAAVLALFAAVVVPNAVSVGVGPASTSAPFATWYIGGIGALMTIVMVRRRPWFAWIGTAVLAGASVAWLGVLPALALGLVGSLVWVTAAQLLVFSFDRAARDTTQLTELQGATSAWQASQAGRQRERRVQVQHALAVAGPILARTIEAGGVLDESERREALVAEGRLRDELRAPRLLDDAVSASLAAARRRGAAITVVDDGGLEDLDDGELSRIRAEVAEAVGSATSARLFIRTSADPRVAVTIVGRSAQSGGMSDEDAVDLWREITYPA